MVILTLSGIRNEINISSKHLHQIYIIIMNVHSNLYFYTTKK